MEATSFVLRAEPQAGDKPGTTTQFVGQLPRDLWGQRLDVTIPALRIGGERFRVGFKSAAGDAHAGAAMPQKVADADERKLYLTPGGMYTAADIDANGGVTPSQKFKGVQAAHDLKPKPGDKICPITLTKANPKFAWVVGGKTYEFCCPPCVDEFVQTAKEKPDEVKDPEAYIKK
jgi:YHS domain-containing protein